jgi:hypothetical protein
MVINPPITTMANGFEASEPIPVESAAGIKPIAAIKAVINTGLNLLAIPSCMASVKVQMVVFQGCNIGCESGNKNNTILHTDAK